MSEKPSFWERRVSPLVQRSRDAIKSMSARIDAWSERQVKEADIALDELNTSMDNFASKSRASVNDFAKHPIRSAVGKIILPASLQVNETTYQENQKFYQTITMLQTVALAMIPFPVGRALGVSAFLGLNGLSMLKEVSHLQSKIK